MLTFTAEELTEICLNVFQKLNIPTAEAEIVTKSMVDANRVGHDSHGVIHLIFITPSLRLLLILKRLKSIKSFHMRLMDSTSRSPLPKKWN